MESLLGGKPFMQPVAILLSTGTCTSPALTEANATESVINPRSTRKYYLKFIL